MLLTIDFTRVRVHLMAGNSLLGVLTLIPRLSEKFPTRSLRGGVRDNL